MYYQFETIHPFNSGNGRVGRLLPALLLMKQGILSKGFLFISEYLHKYNDVCLDLYFGVQHFGNYTEWIKFFLQCIIDSANQTIKRLNVAVDERAKIEVKLQYNGKFSGELTAICDFLEKKPIFMINELVDAFHVSYKLETKIDKPLIYKGLSTLFKAISAILLLIYYFWQKD